MDENKLIRKQLRREFGKNGWALLIYYGVMNVALSIAATLSVLAAVVGTLLSTGGESADFYTLLTAALTENGWGYMLAILIGCVLLLLWKKKEFCTKTIWKPGKPMKFGAFFLLLPVFLAPQAISQLLTMLLDWLLGFLGISYAETVESSMVSTDSFSMFLYVCLLAPVFEEILFRGLILRSLEPYGKRFAIFASSFLFGIFHGNLVQTPYAFLVGLVLGYVTVEYNVIWAMLLHMINNLLLSDTLVRLTGSVSVLAQQIIFAAVIWGFGLLAVVILICKRRAVADYFRREKMSLRNLGCFFTAPGILVISGVMLASIALTVLLTLI